MKIEVVPPEQTKLDSIVHVELQLHLHVVLLKY